jgi:predicted transcriptional regulator
MSRLTITLDDHLHRALKEAAARQGRSIGKIIEESLVLRGIKPIENARELVARARLNAGLGEADATRLALDETRSNRNK